MNKSKKTSITFILISSIINILFAFLPYLLEEEFDNRMLLSDIIGSSIVIVLCIISIITIKRNYRSIAIGILDIIFCGILAGIFYFTWVSDSSFIVKMKNESASSISWVCPNCNKTNYYNTECSCGYKKDDNIIDLKEDDFSFDSEKICPFCNEENKSDAIYCTKCGNKLK